jgi:hypothetical protein
MTTEAWEDMVLAKYNKPWEWRRLTPMGDFQSRPNVYVCGKMRGVDMYNFPAFYCASALLRMWGYDPVNPADMDITDGRAHYNHNTGSVILDNDFTIEDALRRDFRKIVQVCDAIVVLDGWESSEGAQREVAFATSIGTPVFKFDPEKPLNLKTDVPMDITISVIARETAS